MLAHWASSFCFSFASPYMIANVGANTFLIFMGFDILAAIFCIIFVRETRGRNLENAAGTEWETAETAADTEKTDVEREDAQPGVLQSGEKGTVLLNNATGMQVHLVAVHDNFGTNFKRRS